MRHCKECDYWAKTPQGLSSHIRHRHKPAPADPEHGSMRAAVEETIAELRRMGRVEAVDAARVAALRGIADTLDDRPTNAQMWRELRESLDEMTRADDDADDSLAAALASIAGGSEVGDAETPGA